jgi:hypothetical protein
MFCIQCAQADLLEHPRRTDAAFATIAETAQA